MRQLSALLLMFAFFTIVQAQQPPVENSASLFERLGGKEGISKIVDDVVQAHAENPLIKARFLPYLEQPERLAAIKKNTVDFLVRVQVEMLPTRENQCQKHIKE